MSDETYSTDGPVCPYCGKLHKPDEGFFYNEDYSEQQCWQCDRVFSVRVYISHSWTCEAKP